MAEPLVQAGQVWVPQDRRLPLVFRKVLSVDRALVKTDWGQTTVFTLMRHWRVLES